MIGALSSGRFGMAPQDETMGELPPVLAPGPGGGIGGGILSQQRRGDLEGVPEVTDGNPQLPKSKPAYNNPFSSDNLGQTLLDIGQGFLSSNNFFEGLGNVAGGLRSRVQELNPRGKPKVSYGGPNGQFEITEHPDGTRTVRKVPEFAEALKAEEAAKRRLSTKDSNDTVARAVASIGRLDPIKRASAYNFLLQRPAEFGLTAEDVAGLPQEWSDTYGTVRGQMGYSIPQYEANLDRDRAFQHRQAQDSVRNGQAQQRIGISRETSRRAGAKAGAFKAPTGYTLVN